MSENWKKVFLIMFSILFTLLIGEIILQVNYKIKNDHWLWENNAFRVNYIIPTKGRRQYTLRPNYFDFEYDIFINQWGIRTRPWEEGIEENQNIIVCLGDSVPFSSGTSSLRTYPAYLNQNLTSEGFNYYVINAGVPSYNLMQSFDRLEFEILNNIDVENVKVITIQAANDVSLFLYYRENWTPELTWADVRFNIHPIPFANYLTISHYLSQWLSQPIGSSNTYTGELLTYNISLFLQEELRKLQELPTDVIVILLPINPFYYQVENTDKNIELERWDLYAGPDSSLVDSRNQLIRDFNSVLHNVSSEFDNVFFLDVRIAIDKEDRNDLYSDYIHLTPEGNELQADIIMEFLEEHVLIQSSDEQ